MKRPMYKAVLLSAVLALLLVMPSFSAAASQIATEVSAAARCEGFPAYETAMLKAGKRWVVGMTGDGLIGRSARTYSAEEWSDFLAHTTRLLSDLREIVPPAGVESWHQAQITSVQLKASFARSVSMIGFDLAAETMAVRMADVIDSIAASRDLALATCTDFAGFNAAWDALDGTTSTSSDDPA